MTEPEYISTTRAAYDATADIYVNFAGVEVNAITEGPLDRAFLSVFVEYLAAASSKRVADIGCGPGRVAAWLKAQGLDPVGFDMSAEMVAAARTAHPDIKFFEGLLTAIPVADASFDGAVCWYSIIHTPPVHLDAIFSEMLRVLAPGGQILVAFQAGNNDRVDRTEIGGKRVSMTNYRHNTDDVEGSIARAGFAVHARAVRQPERNHETTPQAFILARAPKSAG